LTYGAIPTWNEASATSVVRNYLTDAYDVPSAVMQNAATPSNSSIINFSWDPSDHSVNISSRYFFVFYFAELQSVASNELRQFDIIVNNSTWNKKPYTPPYLFADSFSGMVQGQAQYNISLFATKNATLPPILNAMEIYLVKLIDEIATDPGDGMSLTMYINAFCKFSIIANCIDVTFSYNLQNMKSSNTFFKGKSGKTNCAAFVFLEHAGELHIIALIEGVTSYNMHILLHLCYFIF